MRSQLPQTRTASRAGHVCACIQRPVSPHSRHGSGSDSVMLERDVILRIPPEPLLSFPRRLTVDFVTARLADPVPDEGTALAAGWAVVKAGCVALSVRPPPPASLPVPATSKPRAP